MRYEKKEMGLSTFKKVFDQVSKVRRVNFCGIGEPLLHEDFFDMIQYIRSRSKAEISFSTNGTMLDRDIIQSLIQLEVDKLSISVDGTQEVYEEIRHSSYGKLVSNIDLLNQLKRDNKSSKPNLELEFVCLKKNMNSLMDVMRFAGKNGFYSLYLLHPFCLSKEMFNEHLHHDANTGLGLILQQCEGYAKNKGIQLRSRGLVPSPTLCYEPWYQVTVSEDGYVRPCCFIGTLYDNNITDYYRDTACHINPDDFVFGNCDMSIKKVWKGNQYRLLRRHLLDLRAKENRIRFDRSTFVEIRRNYSHEYCDICQFRYQTAC